MKKIEEINIDNFISTRIEFFNYMKNSYEIIINDILKKRSEYEYNKELLDYYFEKFHETNTSISLLTKNIIKEVNPKYINNNYYYEFNFEKSTVTIYDRKKEE